MKIDEKLIFNRIKKLPSNQRQKILTKTEEKIKAIDAEAKVQVEETKSFLMRYLPSSYNFFDDVPMEENGNETA